MKARLILILILLNIYLHAQVSINELMSNNVSALWDDSYNYSMWVELYNAGGTSVNISQYFLTDNLNEPQKWRLPNINLNSRKFHLIWMEKPDVINHSPFKLDPDGGNLYLLSSNGAIVDEIEYPKQYRNVSYGRKTEGSTEWTFFETHTAGTINASSTGQTVQCESPELKVPGGLYNTNIVISFTKPENGDSIYYTLSGEEPNRTNATYYIPDSELNITKNTVIRAKTISYGKLSSDVTTASYLIGQRDFNLPVVSLVLPSKYLFDNTIGIYVEGTNGVSGCGDPTAHNWNQDWDRPANFELFDRFKTQQLNQEVDIQTAGCFSRANNKQKSLHIQPKKKLGDNTLSYPIFSSRQNRKYKDIMLRNSGNDAKYSMMRDGMMQTLIIDRLDLEYLAYEPSIVFVNGEYFGLFNIRDRSNADLIYTTHGLDEEEIIMTKTYDIVNHPEYKELMNYITNNDISKPEIYAQLNEMMDVENYQNYMLTHMYSANYDWPHNNIKMWKKKQNGKWRWILYDTDFGFNLFIDDLHAFNSLTYALGENNEKETKEWATALFKRLMQNPTFKNSFVDRYSVHLSSTFKTERVNHIIDSLAARIRPEIEYHKQRWETDRQLDTDILRMKRFSGERPGYMLTFLSNRLVNSEPIQTLSITSSISNANYTYNSIIIPDNSIDLQSFKNRSFTLKANNVEGYEFKRWEIGGANQTIAIIPWHSDWKYWDNTYKPSSDWHSSNYSDATWKTGQAQLGYGDKGENTEISFGGDIYNKSITAYFRHSFTIEEPTTIQKASLEVVVDDGAVVYINGTEIGRYNLPTGPIDFQTLAINPINGDKVAFTIPTQLLKKGNNIVAVEVHQVSASSSDLIFNLEMKIVASGSTVQIITTPEMNDVLTTNMNVRAVYEVSNITDSVAEAKIVINEILASNSKYKDEWGDEDDYVELYNAGNKTIDIAGWYLTDKADRPDRWQFSDSSSILIEPGKHLLVWTDEDTYQGILHTNFKLSADGEYVGLYAKNKFGTIILKDSVSYPALDLNRSYSRMGDGGSSWVVLDPTPLAPNLPTSVGTLNRQDLLIYPTSFTSDITIESTINESVKIYDLTGTLWFSVIKSSPVLNLNLHNLPKGIYVIKIGTDTFKIHKL